MAFETYYLIDYENVHSDGLTGCGDLGKADHIVIFFTQNAKNIDMSEISDHGEAELRMIEVPVGKQSADMHISSYLGYLAGQGGKECSVVIVSKDMDFDNVIKFWNEKTGVKAFRAQQIRKKTVSKASAGGKQPAASKKTDAKGGGTQKAKLKDKTAINAEITELLGKGGYSKDIVMYVSSVATKNFGAKNGKQQVYRTLVAKYGQDKGLPIYRQIRKHI